MADHHITRGHLWSVDYVVQRVFHSTRFVIIAVAMIVAPMATIVAPMAVAPTSMVFMLLSAGHNIRISA